LSGRIAQEESNASTTQPAKFLVVFLKKEGAPVLTPVK
jgi:hypothetical protein